MNQQVVGHSSNHARRSRLGALVIAGLALGAAAPAWGAAFVRVNQVGHLPNAPKRAYLMSSAAEVGATFSVKNSQGTVVFTAPIGANLGTWGSFPFVYALDFDAVTASSAYTIVVKGPERAVSPVFNIGSGKSLYGGLLTNALSYYRNSRDGSDFIPSPLRAAPGHLNDRRAKAYVTPVYDPESGAFAGDLMPTGVTLDVEGGWFDAGDYLKMVEPASYAIAMMFTGVQEFPGQLGAGSSNANFMAEAKRGAQWLLKMWDDKTSTLYFQVGIGNGNDDTVSDHDIWRLPEEDDHYGHCTPEFRYICHRPVFRAAPPGAKISPNLAGRFAAVFGQCYTAFKGSDPALARRCLAAGQHIFELADTKPKGDLVTAIPFDFYAETEWRDDLELGATELYLATRTATAGDLAGLPHANPNHYLKQATHWASAYIAGPTDAVDTLNLYDVAGLAHYRLARALGAAGSVAGLEVRRADLIADLKKQLDQAVAVSDPFGFGFPWAAFDTTSHGGGLVMTAEEYGFLTGDDHYEIYAHRWLGNILGANAWGISLIVGAGTTFPKCMQHQIANLTGSLDGKSPRILAGAAVEGPNSFVVSDPIDAARACPADGSDVFAEFNAAAVYQDNVLSWSTNEPALDLTASSFMAFSWIIAGTPAPLPH
jgi:endoglucanase